MSSSSFNHSSWLQCDPRSVRVKDLIRCSTCGFHQMFAVLSFFEDENGQEVFLRFCPDMLKENLIRTKANLRWNNQTENSSLSHICDDWRCIVNYLSQFSQFEQPIKDFRIFRKNPPTMVRENWSSTCRIECFAFVDYTFKSLWHIHSMSSKKKRKSPCP